MPYEVQLPARTVAAVNSRLILYRNPGILIADDLPLILALLKIELEERGFNVWLASNGSEAVDLYLEHRQLIDLVLLDVQMPKLDGPQALSILRWLDPKVIVCFMTAEPGKYAEADLLARGAERVFSKPFRAGDVADTLEQLAPDCSQETFR
jgi:CheY-like chemotaxis protein